MTKATGTPSSLTGVLGPETSEQLEFAHALDLVAARAVSIAGAERIRARRPSPSLEAVAEEMAVVGEVRDLIGSGDAFRPAAIPDIRDSIARLAVPGAVLEGGELVQLGAAMAQMVELHAELSRVALQAPLLAGLATDPPPAPLVQRLHASFEADGTVKDDASRDLARARKRVRTARSTLLSFLDALLRRAGSVDVASDASATLRGGRYVVPVRRESRSRFTGIVHGESGSGATLFIEPTDAIPLGNELNAAEAAEHRAVLAVLRELSEEARRHLDRIADGWEMCVCVDDRYARARFAHDVGGSPPELTTASEELRIVGGRHPILAVESQEVVPFDLETGPEARVFLVSGPNTGGKTVLLKAVGLLSALAQSGIVPPLQPGSRLPVFQSILADIGDQQSIAASLSTFSGHLRAIKHVLETATERALVLLDELGTGTDPAEGAALAGAVLQTLCTRGCVAIATTHLGYLKELAVATPGAINASFQFDPQRLAPTFRLLVGTPGRSYGLAIARRMEFPADVLNRAEALQPETERSLEALLADLEQREHQLEQREQQMSELAARLNAERDGLDALRARLSQDATELDRERRRLEAQGREDARRFLLDARRRVEEALAVARAAVDESTAKAARSLVEQGVRAEGDALKKLEEQARAKGWTVKRAGGDKDGSSDPLPHSKWSRRRPASSSGTHGDFSADLSVTTHASIPMPEARTEIDLRGLTADEAEDAVRRAIDAAQVESLTSLRIIHGKGTGALRQRVTAVLKRDQRVATFRTAAPQEGGWGVTVVEVRA